jgi:dipeptidase E
MKTVFLVCSILMRFFCMAQSKPSVLPSDQNMNRTIFAYGGQINHTFIKHVIKLTGKQNPKICFLPTASGDRESYISTWNNLTSDLPMQSFVQKVFISSYQNPKSFEVVLLDMDAIIVGGGSTFNMLALWKATGIDTVLKKAYNKGIILAGGSAGSLCWFKEGYTDSRPEKFTRIEGLNYINASHCPHYDTEKIRKPLYFKGIESGEITNGYACDELSGVLFQNEKFIKAFSIKKESHCYFLSLVNGKVEEKMLPQEMIE